MGAEKEIDCEFTASIVCPHCGCEHEDCGDVFSGHDDTTRLCCDDCGVEFEVERSFSVSYTSSKIDHAAEARKKAEEQQERAEQIEKCRQFPPGTSVRVTAGHRAGTVGVVANREVSRHVRIETPEGKYITSADPEDVEEIR